MRQFSGYFLLPLLLLALFAFLYLHSDGDRPWKSPFRPSDLLPLLPLSVSWPVLRSLHSAVDLLPTFVGVVSSQENKLEWKGACFYNNTAWMEFHNKSKSPYGGGTLHLKGEDVIAILSWEEWWDFELKKDESNPQIALLPLHPDVRAKFNNTAAWEYARSMDGKPYGYHNMIFSWIDTSEENYPPPLNAHLVASGMTMWTKIQPAYAANMWNEALNKRLGTEGLDLPSIIVEGEKIGLTFDKLLAISEQDDWNYSDGKSTSCVAFILEIYKIAGLFDPIASSIQVNEFTIKDAYTLNFFENNYSRQPDWCNREDTVKLPFCQIKGKYRMELPGYNTMQPYPHMNERCPSLPPNYERTAYC